MKGVVLAGGMGKRLYPLTRITNKHLLPVYDRPMIYYPIQKLVDAGIHDIMIVTGGEHAGSFLRLLGNGKEFGLNGLNYAYQEGEDGIAKALSLSRRFVGNDKVCVILGDNLFEDDIREEVKRFESGREGAYVFLKEVEQPERFGVAVLDQQKRIVMIEEKPVIPKSRYAVTGIYLYDCDVFDVIETLSPSSRGEYEITDVSNVYLKEGRLGYSILKGWWSDAGTFESLFRATQLVRQSKNRIGQD